MTAEIYSVVPDKKDCVCLTTIDNGEFAKILELGIEAIHTTPDYSRITFKKEFVLFQQVNNCTQESNDELTSLTLRDGQIIAVGGQINQIMIRHVSQENKVTKQRRPRTKRS